MAAIPVAYSLIRPKTQISSIEHEWHSIVQKFHADGEMFQETRF
jgi:hypothetical protein